MVDADAGTGGKVERRDGAAPRQHRAICAQPLRVDAELDRESCWRRRRPRDPRLGERRASREQQLRANKVDAGHLLRDRVFDLQPRVCLDEPERRIVVERAPRLDEKLERREIVEARGIGHAHGGGDHAVAQARRQARRRRHFDELLVPPLQRAVAFPQVRNRLAIARHLDLDVARRGDKTLSVQGIAAKRRLRLGRATLVCLLEVDGVADHPHPASAAPGDRLDHHASAALLREKRAHHLDRCGALDAGQHRHLERCREVARPRLVPEAVERVGMRPDEGQARRCARAREAGALAEKAIARVHGIAARAPRDVDELRGVEIRGGAPAGERMCLIDAANVQRRAVVLRVDTHRRDFEICGRPRDANCNFAAVGDEKFRNGHLRASRDDSGAPIIDSGTSAGERMRPGRRNRQALPCTETA